LALIQAARFQGPAIAVAHEAPTSAQMFARKEILIDFVWEGEQVCPWWRQGVAVLILQLV